MTNKEKSHVERIFNTTTLNKPHFGVISNKLSRIVSKTLGPMGKNVMIYGEHGLQPTKDGITVLENVRPVNAIEEAYVNSLIASSRNLLKSSGDGTTTALMFLTNLINGVISLLEEYEEIPTFVLENVFSAIANDFAWVITENKMDINDLSQLTHIASISLNNNMELLQLVQEAFYKTLVERKLSFDDLHMDISPSSNTKHSVEFRAGYGIVNNTKIKIPTRASKVKGRVLMANNQFTDHKVADAVKTIIDDFNHNPDHENEYLFIMSSEIFPNMLRQVAIHLHTEYSLKNIPNRVILNQLEGIGVAFTDTYEDIKDVMQNHVDFEVHEEALYEGFDYFKLPLTTIHLSQAEIVIEPVLKVDSEGALTNKFMDENLVSIQEGLDNPNTPNVQAKVLRARKRMMGKSVCTINVGGETDQHKKKNISQLDDATKAVNSAAKEGYVAGACSAIAKAGEILINRYDDTTFLPSNNRAGMIKHLSELGIDRDRLNNLLGRLVSITTLSATQITGAIAKNANVEIDEDIVKLIRTSPWDVTYDVITRAEGNRVLNPVSTDIHIIKSSLSLISTLLTSDTLIHDSESATQTYAAAVASEVDPII